MQMTLPMNEGKEYTGGLTFVAGRHLCAQCKEADERWDGQPG